MEFFDYLTHVSLNWNTKKYKTYEQKAIIKLIVIFIAAFIIGLGISFQYDLWAGIATFFMFAVVIKINNSLTNSKSQQFELDAHAHLNQLSTLFTLTARRDVSIANLREQLAKADNSFTKVPHQIFSILDNASARDMVLWATPVPTNETNLDD